MKAAAKGGGARKRPRKSWEKRMREARRALVAARAIYDRAGMRGAVNDVDYILAQLDGVLETEKKS